MAQVPEGQEPGQARIVWPEDALWPQGGYGNAFMVNHTPWDFTLRFGHVVLPPVAPGAQPPPEGIEIMATPVAQVTMPPPALLQFSIVIQQQIAAYQNNYGPIGGAPPEQGISGG